MRICVFGLWHLGSVTCGALAKIGYDVIGYDQDQKIVKGLSKGSAPISEPGLDDVISSCIKRDSLSFISSKEDIPTNIDAFWVAVDTPVDEDDIASPMSVINDVCETLSHLPEKTIIIVSSQLPVGSLAKIESYAMEFFSHKSFVFALIPENLRLGQALDVFLKPDRIIAGVRDNDSRDLLQKLLSPLSKNIVWMSIESAEMTKHSINAFLAMSIVFANEIASICELVGANASEVELGLKSEERIGQKAYLSAGGAFAGGTLARDLEYLKAVSGDKIPIKLLTSVKISNDLHKDWVRRKLQTKFPNFQDLKITIWGLAYKPKTNTLRRSSSLELCEWLLKQQVKLVAFDPLIKVLPGDKWSKIKLVKNWERSLDQAQVLIIMTPWMEFRDYVSSINKIDYPNLSIIDPSGLIKNSKNAKGIEIISIGNSNSNVGQNEI